MITIFDSYEFTDLINGVILDTVEHIQDKEYDFNSTGEIASDLLEYDYRNGSYYCNSNKALDDIYQNFYTVADIINDRKDWGYTFTSIFDSVETLHLEILYHGVEERLSCYDVQDFLEEHADDYGCITFDSELIEEFKELFTIE